MTPVFVPSVVQGMYYMDKFMQDGSNAYHLDIFFCRYYLSSYFQQFWLLVFYAYDCLKELLYLEQKNVFL